MAKPKMAQDRVDKIRRLRMEGLSQFEIGIEMDVSRKTVWRFAGDIPYLPKRPHSSRKVDPDRVKELRAKGMTLVQIQERLGVSKLSSILAKAKRRARRREGNESTSKYDLLSNY